MAALTASTPTPKPLLPIDGRDGSLTFLDWHLRCLAAAGTEEIYLVGSPRTFGTRLASMDVVAAEWILNPTEPASASGSAHSAWYAWQSWHRILDGRSRVILMDADVVYDPALLADLVAAAGDRSTMLVAREHANTGEEVLVFADSHALDRPRRQGKGLWGSSAVAGLECIGEATGIVLWGADDHAMLAERTDRVVHSSPTGPRSEHEVVTELMMAAARVRALTFGGDRVFLEVDTPDDYRTLIDEVVPRLPLPSCGR